MTSRDWIKAAHANDPMLLRSGIRFLFNCHVSEVTGDGDVWIANPQRGHWLNDADLSRVAANLEEGRI